VVTVKERTGCDAVLSGKSSSTFQWNVPFLASACFLLYLLFYLDDGGSMSLRNIGKTCTRLHRVTSENTVFFILFLFVVSTF
jgi:hypothetical protein